MEVSSQSMKVKQGAEQAYQRCIELNSNDTLGKAVLDFMTTWVDLMEKEITDTSDIETAAETALQKIDQSRITGFMRSLAVEALAEYWEYGGQLRDWYNKKNGYAGPDVYNRAYELLEKPKCTKEEIDELINELCGEESKEDEPIQCETMEMVKERGKL